MTIIGRSKIERRTRQCSLTGIYRVYERLKQYAARMEVISIRDLEKKDAMSALQKYRKRFRDENIDETLAEKIYNKVGGRLAFLNRVAKSKDMLQMCDEIIKQEKTWLLNQCGLLGSSMDDDGTTDLSGPWNCLLLTLTQ